MKNTVLVAIACLSGGGALGYFLGSGNDAPVAEADQASSSRVSERRISSLSSDRSEGPQSYEEIAATPGQMNRIQSLVDLYSNLKPGEYAEEADKLDSLPFSERILAAYLLFAAWAEVSPIDAMSHANSKMGFAGNFVKPTVLQSWAATDPSAAASYYQSNKGEFAMMGMMGRGRGGGGGDSGASVIAGEWAKQDPEGAMNWAKSLEGREATRATSGVLSELAKSDPAKAAEMVSEIDEGGRAGAYASIAGEWAKKDWASTEFWIGSLPSDQKDAALGSAIKSLAATDTALAAQKTLGIPEGDARTNAIEEVSGVMAKTDPSGAMDWVMLNGNEDAQRESVGDVMQSWVAEDAQAARTWIDGQAEGEVRDAAVGSYVFNNQSAAPQDNIALAETITDERTRDRAIGMTAYRWMNDDSAAATEYIQNSDAVSDRIKERVLNSGGQ
ncbi:hypothetical protein N9908_06245 [Akkermansiaceae bacterium]|nr:hypothetical protein [Akkermansiaceae bacterium]MDB4333461.1 hypothetical protein [Akkermansiaceae bacterium]